MKILYDHQIFTSQIYGGISRYFCELLENFKNDNEIEYKLSLKYSNNYYIGQLDKLIDKELLKNISIREKYKLQNGINKILSLKNIYEGKYSVFHPTYYDPYFIKFLKKKPFVLTIYDMIHEIFPEMFSSKDKTSERKKALAQKATKIIAISENTKKDIIKFLGISEDKIEVIYLANSININKNNDNINIALPEKYILYVGSRRGYKNFELFIDVISPLLRDENNLNLVCAGGGDFRNYEISKFKKLNINKRLFYYSGNDAILSYLYRNAIAFVSPSLYEGFGIPLLESFACECPVICSIASSFPEVAGDAAIYFDPTDKSSILNSIQKVIYDDELRDQLVYKGSQRVKEFTWEKTAKKTKKIYEDIL